MPPAAPVTRLDGWCMRSVPDLMTVTAAPCRTLWIVRPWFSGGPGPGTTSATAGEARMVEARKPARTSPDKRPVHVQDLVVGFCDNYCHEAGCRRRSA